MAKKDVPPQGWFVFEPASRVTTGPFPSEEDARAHLEDVLSHRADDPSARLFVVELPV